MHSMHLKTSVMTLNISTIGDHVKQPCCRRQIQTSISEGNDFKHRDYTLERLSRYAMRLVGKDFKHHTDVRTHKLHWTSCMSNTTLIIVQMCERTKCAPRYVCPEDVKHHIFMLIRYLRYMSIIIGDSVKRRPNVRTNQLRSATCLWETMLIIVTTRKCLCCASQYPCQR